MQRLNVTANNEFVRMRKEVVGICYNMLSRNFRAGRRQVPRNIRLVGIQANDGKGPF